MKKQTADDLKLTICSDIRIILKLREKLRKPLDQFITDPSIPDGEPRHHIIFDPEDEHMQIIGLKMGMLSLNIDDERIVGRVHELAGKVWHLKDKLAKWAKLNRIPLKIDDYVNQSQELKMTADLANFNKHHEHKNRSGVSPEIHTVRFDTSKSGVVELYYNGATKDKEVRVTNLVPIRYSVVIRIGGGAELGDATEIIYAGFKQWIPLIKNLRLLSGDTPDMVYLRSRLNI